MTIPISKEGDNWQPLPTKDIMIIDVLQFVCIEKDGEAYDVTEQVLGMRKKILEDRTAMASLHGQLGTQNMAIRRERAYRDLEVEKQMYAHRVEILEGLLKEVNNYVLNGTASWRDCIHGLITRVLKGE